MIYQLCNPVYSILAVLPILADDFILLVVNW
jgi:hypothetical protein